MMNESLLVETSLNYDDVNYEPRQSYSPETKGTFIHKDAYLDTNESCNNLSHLIHTWSMRFLLKQLCDVIHFVDHANNHQTHLTSTTTIQNKNRYKPKSNFPVIQAK